MVVLTITAASNPCTVFFEYPIPEANYVSLLSCLLPNSWFTLKKNTQIILFSEDGESTKVMNILEGHHTLETMASAIENAFEKYAIKLPTEINSPYGVMVIKNETFRRVDFYGEIIEFLGGIRDLKFITFVKKLGIPSTYSVYCDLVDSERNLENGKRSKLLAQFEKKGKPFEKVLYKNEDILSRRDASTGQSFNSVTLEVKDERGELFDFRGEKISFVLSID